MDGAKSAGERLIESEREREEEGEGGRQKQRERDREKRGSDVSCANKRRGMESAKVSKRLAHRGGELLTK